MCRARHTIGLHYPSPVSTPLAALPADAVLLHIGPFKTGTTAMQAALAASRETLAAQGVTYPGRRGAQHPEARFAIGKAAGWAGDSEALAAPEVWQALVDEVAATPGRVVISSEFFSLADQDQRVRVADDLGRDRLYILVAARNPAALAVSTWQQVLRDGHPQTFEEWLTWAFRRPEPGPATKGFWLWTDTAAQVASWAAILGEDRIRVIVLDETDRELLPRSFEELLAVTPGCIAVPEGEARHNRSLTPPEADLLRRAIQLTRKDLTWAQYSLLFRAGMVHRLLYSRVPAPGEPRTALPAWVVEQAKVEADALVERLQALDVTIVGDLEALRRTPDPGEPWSSDQVPVEIAAIAIEGVVGAALRGMRQAEARGARRARARHRQAGPSVEELSTADLVRVLRSRLAAKAGLRRNRPPARG